jgi:phosphatidylserine/phosphatidylglycerophosphate/cardiolipin synthase-like enzyme
MKGMRRISLFWTIIPISLALASLPLSALSAEDIEIIQNREYFPSVHRALQEAEESIRVIMYWAEYYEKYPDSPSNILIRDLIEAHRRGVKVEVILELGTHDDVNRDNAEVTQRLSDEGVAVVFDSPSVTTHTKLMTIDGEITVLGSTNWKYHSLDKNNEVSVLIKSREIAAEIEEYFKRIWNTCYIKISGK